MAAHGPPFEAVVVVRFARRCAPRYNVDLPQLVVSSVGAIEGSLILPSDTTKYVQPIVQKAPPSGSVGTASQGVRQTGFLHTYQATHHCPKFLNEKELLHFFLMWQLPTRALYLGCWVPIPGREYSPL